MKRTILMLVLVLAVAVAACAPVARASIAQSQLPRVSSPAVPDADLQAVVEGNSRFACDLYRVLRAEPGNIFFSPYSVSIALAMTYAGARGETAQQMADTLYFALPQERLHPAFNALDLAVTRPGEAAAAAEEQDFRLNVANSLWGQKDYVFLAEFLDLLAQNYGAGMRLVDFESAPEPARLAINRWVSDQTEGKIEDLIPPGAITDLTRLVLANAIYFDARWVYPFDRESTQDGLFNLLDGGQVSVPMMRMSRPAVLRYAQGAGYQAVELPYKGDRASMLLLVPDAGAFADFEATLDADRIATTVASLQPQPVALTLPKFSYDSDFSLAETLAGLGMPDAICGYGRADFSGMDGVGELCISAALHKAFVAVDEAGTEAAAATAIVMGATSAQPAAAIELRIDRPFIFLIRDTQTGSILFLGRVLDPTE